MRNSQRAIRGAMISNTQWGKSNGWKLPKISMNVSSIIDGHEFQNVNWLWDNQWKIQDEMKTVFMDFYKRYKKYTKSELSESDMKSIYEEFVLNYESIRGYMKNTKIWDARSIEKISQLWDDDFIFRYFWQDSFIADELGISEEEVRENFRKWVKLHFAIKNISDPMEAMRRVKKHLDETLSDENIGRELGISEEEVRENFRKWVKLYFAIKNISDPMDGCRKWRNWEILYGNSIFRNI